VPRDQAAQIARMKVLVSVLIPVKNEEANLPRCLAALSWADEIFVVDSQSTDRTREIAEAAGARVVQFHFNGTWPKKKNWALENLPFAHEWVLIVDADEVMPREAEAEIREAISRGDFAGFWINRRFVFASQPLRHAYFPNWNLRLFRHALGRFEKITDADTRSGDNEVHEHVVVRGATARLRCVMEHHSFPDVATFVEKHNRYSNWEARVAVERARGYASLQDSRVGWRRRLRNFSRALPCRPLLRFLYVFVWQRGFLDGRAGFYFARLHAIYEELTVMKTWELRKKNPPHESP
jgi:glycosyltransferase involved in cell wall biosynthesis